MHQQHKWMLAGFCQKRALLFAVNILAGLCIFFFGYDQGMLGGINESPHYIKLMDFGYIGNDGKPVITNSLLQGGITSVYYLGTLVGCLLGGSIGDRFGRINTIAIGAVWGIIGASLQTSAMNHNWMIGARLVNGIGTGILNGIVPVWASEIAEYSARGTFIAMEFTLNIIFGVVVAYWLGFGLSFIDNGQSAFRWRFEVAFQLVPLLFVLALCFFFPESPRWLCKVGRGEEALYVLQRLRNSTEQAEAGVADIHGNNKVEETSEGTSYYQMFFGLKSGHLHTGRRVQLCIWLQILQSWTGIAGITIYGPTIFSIAGFSTQKTLWISGLNNIFYTFATLICVFTIDRIGRRWTLWWGSGAQAVAMFLVGGLSRGGLNARAAGNFNTANEFGAAAASFVFIYTFIFGATWLTVPWLYPAEIFSLHVRAKGNAWGVVGWSIGNGTLTLALPYIIGSISEKTFYIFGAVNIISIPIVWALYPESNQRTLEEMDMFFAADTPWAWDAQATFERLQEQTAGAGGAVRDTDKGIEVKHVP
ncbi:general substrate transporter [Xylaria venustula]|nr:general substrate transporter [Xylaria venustula]